MSAWAVKDKTESWDTICDLAWAGEPQFVTRGPSQTVVVISYVDYRHVVPTRQKAAKKSNRLLDALRRCPCGDDLAAAIDDRGESIPSYFDRCGGFEEKS